MVTVAAPVEPERSTSETVDAPRPRPVELLCRACGGWIATAPAGTPWLRGRCGNRKVDGNPGRKCNLYAKTQTTYFGPRLPVSEDRATLSPAT